MTLFRTIVILVGGLLIMLTVVILRAQTTRLHYEISQCERRTDQYRQQLHDGELELARLRNPMMIRQQVKETVSQLAEEASEKAEKAVKPARATKEPTKKRNRP
jgi:hypothetical protein